MRAVIQRVSEASVETGGALVGACGTGFLILLGVCCDDKEEDAALLAEKICKLRVFSDENGKMNRSLTDVDGGVLIVSNFTLYANVTGGNRPDFLNAASPERANYLYRFFIEKMRGKLTHVAEGVFGADMIARLKNDGPVTLVIDSECLKKRKVSTNNA